MTKPTGTDEVSEAVSDLTRAGQRVTADLRREFERSRARNLSSQAGPRGSQQGAIAAELRQALARMTTLEKRNAEFLARYAHAQANQQRWPQHAAAREQQARQRAAQAEQQRDAANQRANQAEQQREAERSSRQDQQESVDWPLVSQAALLLAVAQSARLDAQAHAAEQQLNPNYADAAPTQPAVEAEHATPEPHQETVTPTDQLAKDRENVDQSAAAANELADDFTSLDNGPSLVELSFPHGLEEQLASVAGQDAAPDMAAPGLEVGMDAADVGLDT